VEKRPGGPGWPAIAGPVSGEETVVSPKLWKLLAIPIGLAFAAVPAAAVHFWLGAYLEQRSINELETTAKRVIRLTETRLGDVIEGLDALAARGVTSCAGGDRAAMHDVNFRVVPIKEISIVGADTATVCTSLDVVLGRRHVVSEPIENTRTDVVVEIVRLNDKSNLVRVRRASVWGTWLAALVPVEMLVPRTSSNGGPVIVNATLASADGTVIGERSPDLAENDGDGPLLTAQLKSERFGFVVTASMPRARAIASGADLVLVAALGTGLGTALILTILAFGPWRRRDNPVTELQHAIRNEEFVPYYQPIVDLATARIVSAEVLVRWRKPDGTLVPPVQFIPLAESSGLIVELTRALMRRVCVEAGAAIGAQPNFRVGFNLSAQHFLDETIVDDVRAIFGASPIAVSQLLLEVTERQPLENLTMARRVIAALQGIGASVGLDDVGTGHSGLSYMLKLGVDFIKIDKIFVDAIGTERYSTTIIETLVTLARDMHMEIIAEGVETFEQVQHLRERGIRKAQGYVFAPPLPGTSFIQLLQANAPCAGAEPSATADTLAMRVA
jgi:sensor c-di-GMP phosphodiesterase-like protein